jgi:hypothetical protein
MITKKTNISLLLLQTSSAHPSFNTAFLNRHTIHTTPSSVVTSKTRLFYVQDPIPENNDEPPSSTTTPTEEKDQLWMSATRTLGSLFLHQQDASSASVGSNQYNNANADNNTTSTGEAFHESVFSSYLLNLKREEEVNREKTSRDNDDDKKLKKKKKDVEKSDGDLKEITVDFVIDQVNICERAILTFF